MPRSRIEIDSDKDAFGGAVCGTSLKLHVSFRLTQFRHDGRFSSHYRIRIRIDIRSHPC
jgi:hypothetical protein